MAHRKSTKTKAKGSASGPGLSEEERLRQDIYRPDMEKLHLFTQMLKVESLYKKAKITHK